MVAPVRTNMRQELFLRECIKTGNQALAWRRVYKTRNLPVSWSGAAKCLAKPHVRKRYNELRERQMKKSDISIDKVLSDYQHAIDLAKGQQKAGEIIAGASAQAKLVGLLRDRVETGAVGEFGDTNSIADILELVAKEAGPEAAMALATMFGLKGPVSKDAQETALFNADPASDAVN